jgi:hypothetical protein
MPFMCCAALLFRGWLSAPSGSRAAWATRRQACRLRNLPPPESWLPYVFTSPEEAAEAGVCELSSVSWYGKR